MPAPDMLPKYFPKSRQAIKGVSGENRFPGGIRYSLMENSREFQTREISYAPVE